MNYFPPEKLGGLPCLSVWQPWPWCMFYPPDGERKDVENRDWWPVNSLYGRDLAIHAGKCDDEYEMLAQYIQQQFGIEVPSLDEAVFGAIIGVVRLVKCCRHPVGRSAGETRGSTSPVSRWAEQGKVHWIFDNPRPLQTPILYRGRQKLFTLTQRELDSALPWLRPNLTASLDSRPFVRSNLTNITGSERGGGQ